MHRSNASATARRAWSAESASARRAEPFVHDALPAVRIDVPDAPVARVGRPDPAVRAHDEMIHLEPAGDHALFAVARRRDRLLPFPPPPTQRVGQDRGAVVAVVAAGARDEPHVVARILERAGHRLISDPPVAAVDVEVAAPILEEDADRPRLGLANERRVGIAAAQARVRADERAHAAERVGPVPGGRERADATGRGPADADGDRHLAAVDQVVEDDGDAPAAVLRDESAAVLEHHDRGRRLRPILGRNTDPIVTLRSREDSAPPRVLAHPAGRHARLALGVGRQRVLGLRRRGRRQQRHGDDHQGSEGGRFAHARILATRSKRREGSTPCQRSSPGA